ncbi:MAG: SMC-Scp complex subunit ScpB [Epulopiscium sp. Nele67-Bin004]|nr:MAG: SMC-Scp complex subunit ScpB [Epulopiscium sp. Nele67-Bin004]
MKRTDLESKVESLLFFVGDIVMADKLCEVCEATDLEISMAIYNINQSYEKVGSDIRIVEVDTGYQMCTQNVDIIVNYKKKPVKKLLTQTLLETLALIAYSQPITKVQIEDIRGVRSEHAVAKLIDYNLVEEVGRLTVIGRPILLGTTQEFLRHFGFKNIEELPVVQEELIEMFKKEVQAEMNYHDEIK